MSLLNSLIPSSAKQVVNQGGHVGDVNAATVVHVTRFKCGSSRKQGHLLNVAPIALLAVNIWGIPHYSYMACAWGGVAGYGTAMLLSYFVGQRINPIPYPIGSIALYVIIAAAFYWVMTLVPTEWPMYCYLAISTLLILVYAAIIYKKELRKGRVA